MARKSKTITSTIKPAIAAPKAAVAALAKVELDLAAIVAEAAARTVGSGGGYKGQRHNDQGAQLLADSLKAGNVDKASPEALALSFSIAIATGFCRWILMPSDDGTLSHGKAPLAPLDYDGAFWQGAAVAAIPPCGAFQGGLEVVAHATIPAKGKAKAKQGLAIYRLIEGKLAPAVLIAEGKAVQALEQASKDSGLNIETVALVAHLGAHNQGGKLIASLASAKNEGGK